MARPLDRARPLWELYLIHGLESGYTGMLTKIHHAVIDGLSGAEIMSVLLDLEPEGRELPPPPSRAPKRRRPAGRVGDALAGAAWGPALPMRLLRSLPALPNLDETAFNTLPGAGFVARAAERLGRIDAARERWWSASTCDRRGPPSTAASRRIAGSCSASCRSTR